TEQKSSNAPADDLIFGWHAIDVFTGALVVATLLLAGIAIRQDRHNRLVERAYVSGGGSYNTTQQIFVLQVNNYGKTPGELLRIEIGFCELAVIPPIPNYQMNIAFRDFLPPDLRSRSIRWIPVSPALVQP